MDCECHPKPAGTNPDCPVHGLSQKAEERRVERQPTTYKPEDLDELKRMWDELPVRKRIKIRTMLYEGILSQE